MVKIYMRRIRAGEMAIEEVPSKWREAVRQALNEEETQEEQPT